MSTKMSDVETSYHTVDSRRIKLGNPDPLGLFSFASSTLLLSLYNVHARGIDTPNVVVGMAPFCSGLAQLPAGAFWLSFATLLIPGSGISAACASSADPAKEADVIAIYLTSWAIDTFLFFVATLRKSIGLTVLFFLLTLTFAVLAIADFWKNESIGKAGGAFGIVTALIAYYCGLAELLTEDDLFTIPLGKHAAKMA